MLPALGVTLTSLALTLLHRGGRRVASLSSLRRWERVVVMLLLLGMVRPVSSCADTCLVGGVTSNSVMNAVRPGPGRAPARAP